MNIIFLLTARVSDIRQRDIYTDLVRKFRDEGHKVYLVVPHERRTGLPTTLEVQDGVHILGVKTLNVQKTGNIIEKGIGTLLIEPQFISAIKKYLSAVHFDLILYSTPPITFAKVIRFLRKRNPSAQTYLLLKDIFPQNAVDIGMMTTTGIKGLLYKYFRRTEKRLYALSDHIGCMSPANVRFLLSHNPEVSPDKVEVAPNSLEPTAEMPALTPEQRIEVRARYGLPLDKPVFIYGGNLGKPQGIPFLIQCLNANSDRRDCHFVVVGTGTELPALQGWFEKCKPSSVTVMNGLPTDEYDKLVRACDVGLIFLDHRFTIPNYPSRLLSYLVNGMPVLCATDPNTDIGRIAEENGYGYWCESNSVEAFTSILHRMLRSDRKAMGQRGYDFFKANYTVQNTYDVVMRHLEK